VDRITVVNTGGNGDVGVSRVTAEVAKVISQVPPVLESLTGLKVEQLLERLQAARAPTPPSRAEPPPTA
jgi:flotillin